MLSVEAVSKTFGGVQALRSASLSCAAGEILGLIGPNGAGKSTLVNAIAGVLKPDAGSVKLAGKEITGHGPEHCARAGVGRTFQTIRLFRDLTVRQNVEVAHITCRSVRPDVAARIGVDRLLAQYQLDGFADIPAGTLSYGSQRRLEIARALALGPLLLLLDEPAAGLNEDESETLAVAIEGIRRDVGCATIVIDHDLRFINRLCDRLCVMDQGQVIASGQTEEVWRDPRVIEVYVGQAETS
ncbi:amino acid ABC transporter ATP-binding protein [Mesorhizobium sanjuanii]|uniref:Amino acid ABC transporter ATP-binding protein n=1 Tax=Mesorhizobium sanjuanii TaxID=2037900 RepID=A0A2A6FBQ9_9HYPH|nr:ATP-binding cassette domain-containing protein [Mesorhizobium sanjuanii]PDQ19379.1 amino acid ABC transporter ATP-binding protein [Mesorhizobium sanjuanii]